MHIPTAPVPVRSGATRLGIKSGIELVYVSPDAVGLLALSPGSPKAFACQSVRRPFGGCHCTSSHTARSRKATVPSHRMSSRIAQDGGSCSQSRATRVFVLQIATCESQGLGWNPVRAAPELCSICRIKPNYMLVCQWWLH